MFASQLFSHILLAAALTFHAGQQPFSFAAPQLTSQAGVASKIINGFVWYPVDASIVEQAQSIGNPAHPIFDAGSAAVGAPIARSAAAFPLILLSHGTGGSAHQLAWLGTALARAGFIAVAIDHPGNTSEGELTVQGFTLWWLRARELSAALDAILADPAFGPHVDRTRIAAAGFSLGGYTTIAIAGGRVDFAALDATCAKNPNAAGNCQSPPEFPDLVEKMAALQKSDPSYAKALAGSNQPVSDSRVRAIYGIAPPGGDAVTTQSLQTIHIPVRIAYGTNDTTVTPSENAMVYAKTIPGATLLTVPGAAHYTFLDTCTALGVQRIGAICTDAPGVDRDAVHALVANDAIAYFDRALAY
jgi:predicted dienelactone hydrolase